MESYELDDRTHKTPFMGWSLVKQLSLEYIRKLWYNFQVS